MAATHGLGTYGNGAGTVTPLDHKLADAGLISKQSGILIRPGLFWGGSATIVTGAANMSYNIAAFTAALTRGASSGAVLLANDGTVNLTKDVAGANIAAPGSNSAYHLVFVWQREYSLDGTDSNPVIGVLQGTAAASPTVPSLAAYPGAIALAQILVPAGVTATNTGTTITQLAPFTSVDGGDVKVRNSTELTAYAPQDGATATQLDTLVQYKRVSGAWKTVQPGSGYFKYTGTALSAPNNSGVVLPWDASDYYNTLSSAFTYTRATGLFTCAQAGTYLFEGDVQFSPATAGLRGFYITRALAATPTTFVGIEMATGSGSPAYNTSQPGRFEITLAVGDVVQMGAIQTSGATLTVVSAKLKISQIV